MNHLEDLGEYLFSLESTKCLGKRGFCRLWTRVSFIETRLWMVNNNYRLIIEAREKIVGFDLYHTFLRVSEEKDVFVYDGTGFLRNAPWWGREDGSWYQNSRTDAIQLLIEEEISRMGIFRK